MREPTKRASPAEIAAAKKPKRKLGPARKQMFDCKLREMRQAIGLTIKDVANGVKMSCAGLFEIEHGGDPQLSTALKIAAFFGTDVDSMWERIK